MPELAPAIDPIDQIRQRLIAINQEQAKFERNGFDAQEEQERLAATQAYLGENEAHFVSFVEECVRTSAQANYDIRGIQQECWRVYQEEPPPNYAAKEEWQSKVIVPKPHGAVQFAEAAVKRAFNPDFLSIEDEKNEKLAEFWRKLMHIQYNRQHAKFVRRFTRATGFGFATGQSFEFIPIWRRGHGLDFSLVEPWKIHRDPDARSEEPQSGMYWIHEEWQDLYVLRKAEKEGRYVNTAQINGSQHEENNPQNTQMDKTQEAELKKQLWVRNRFRQSVLTREYWGTMLDPRGNELHPNLTLTVAGGRVIALPRPTQYPTIRWPGSSYSPLPNFLRFEGRSLLQSVRSLWYFMCNLQALHNDYMNWVVNPMLEINQRGLVDQDDIDVYPGKPWLTQDTANGQQVVRTIDRRLTTNEILANKQAGDQDFQRGVFITDPIQGLPGFRQQITARESAQNLQQAMTVFSIIGENLDAGAIDITTAAMETIMLNITRDELLDIFEMAELIDYFGQSENGLPAIFVDDAPTGVRLPRLRGTFHVSGLQSLLKDAEVMAAIRNVILPMTENPFFQDFLVPHKIAKSIELRSGLQDEGMLVSETEAIQIDQARKQNQQAMAKMQLEALQRQQQLEEQKMQIETEKLQLDAQKMELEGRKIELETMKQELEAQRKQAELQGELAERALSIEQQQVEIERIGAEIARTEMEIHANAMKLQGDLDKTQAQIDKTQSQIALAERKMQLEERIAKAQIQLQREAKQQSDNEGQAA